ncbi:hypothetical protein D1816_17555 [Aquimarina sp. AD10]|uniref:Adhesin domain-containing protein n=1 Tax=Aquimarina aggregata TaxID=1642818 RepID=A0A162ZGY3_9FLAO|nr:MULTISPECIES: DUF4097 family beta strand repeat-containing protein [Aquimarina]AXT62087.1 hypothetical protein D1816_17555 [Aquimarina sp. AD10]KZS39787.1 hypothetical protein AWE51_09050 [Aquimarina aggregata]RKM99924.1 hypothetical protein D7033_10025 [Aquimarina sp. AD10]
MKKIVIALLLYVVTGNLTAQNHSSALQGVKKVKISSASGTNIKTHAKNELLIIGDGHSMPEKAKGLKAVYAGGSDNTGMGVYINKEGETLVVRNLKGMNSKTLEIYLPKDINITVEKSNLGHLSIEGFSSEIEARTNVGNIILKDVTGPIVAKTSTGEINVIFKKVSQSSPISLISSTGPIDISIPSNTAANLELKTSMGEIYTDFDIKFPSADDDMRIVAGKRTVKTSLNNGGVDISLRSSTGNIYLRKQ